MERAEKRLEERQNALSVALKSGDKESIAKAKKSLEDAQRAVTFHDTKYKAMVEDTALRISKANQTALDYVNGKTPNIYANNFNQINGDAKKVGIKFTTINEDVVRKRIAEGDIKLPKPRVSVPKDVRWNTKKMNSAVLQGILQGESMNDIAKRLLPIVDSNASSAIRNARTLVTQAENSGRLDSYKALEEEGAVLKKVWMATADDRTRVAHLELDGEEVDIDEPFIDIDGNALMFPADPSADPSTVYNCRCTMVTRIVSVNGNEGDTDVEEVVEKVTEESSKEELAETKEVKTKQEAIEQLGNIFARVDSSMKNMNGTVVVDITNQLSKLNAKYAVYKKEAVDDFKKAKQINPRSARPHTSIDIGAGKNMAQAIADYSINLNGAMFRNRNHDKWRNAELDKEKVAWFMPRTKETAPWTYVITHEYGHNLEYSVVRQRIQESGKRVVLNEERFLEKTDEIREEILKIAKDRNADFSAVKQLSDYGKSNSKEFFAECFANSQLGKPNELGEAMNIWLEREGF